MKKTKYFTSKSAFQYNTFSECANDLVKQRDAFLAINKLKIVKIDSENISYVTMQNNNYLFGTLTLSYYEEEWN